MRSYLPQMPALPATRLENAVRMGEPNAIVREARGAERAALGLPGAEEAVLRRWEPLARHLARRFAAAAETEDLEQIARLALLSAARRFDPAHGAQFQTFAARTILGHLRHYIRDRAPAIRIPRRWWELRPHVEQAREQLTQELGRAPAIDEIAARLGLSEEDVVEVLVADEFVRLERLDQPRLAPEDGSTELLSETIGGADPRLEALELHLVIQQAMEGLPEPLREIVHQRYFLGQSQEKIAQRLGVSQMQVSRMERRALAQLREEMRCPGRG